MSELALLFPGQGSERQGMGLGMAERSPAARELIDAAAAASDSDLWRLLRQGGPEWGRTEVMQPLLVAICLGAYSELRRAGIAPAAVAGHSLGELSAWSAAGSIEPLDAVRLAAVRGRLMEREADRLRGGMVALVGADEREARRAARIGAAVGEVTVAGCNSRDQWVLSGEMAALRQVAGAVPCRWLPVAGPWHSSAMAGAVQDMRDALRATDPLPTKTRFVSAATGQEESNPAQIVELLAEQLVAPFHWDQVMATLWGMGIRRFVTVGPGTVLRALIRSNLGPEAVIHGVDSAEDVSRIATQVAS